MGKNKKKGKLLLIYNTQDFILVSYFKGVHFYFIIYAEGNHCLLLLLSLALIKVLLFGHTTALHIHVS